jgi:hypothetical protein
MLEIAIQISKAQIAAPFKYAYMHEIIETPDITLKILALYHITYNPNHLFRISLDEQFLDTIPFTDTELILEIKKGIRLHEIHLQKL